jgi:hypothetical protein
MTITATAHAIVLIARHPASEPPPPQLALAVAAIAALLDAAGITYTAREFTATIADTEPPERHRNRPTSRKPHGNAAA